LTLLQNVDQTTIGNVNQDAIAKYIVLAMLFGLRDNFDKNISYRSWAGNACRPDFYDMDTALGLDNQGKETQSPMMLFKYLTNQNDS